MFCKHDNHFFGLGALALALMLWAAPASADTFGFISLNNSLDVDNLTMNVVDLGSGQVGFNFANNVTDSSVVTTIYWDFGDLGHIGALSSVIEVGTVDYSDGSGFYTPTPFHFPDGNFVNFTADFGIDAKVPSPYWGIDNGESLNTIWTLANGITYADIIAALDSGNMMVGMHIQGLPGGLSASVVTTSATPIPGAVWLLGSGLAGLVGLRRRFMN